MTPSQPREQKNNAAELAGTVKKTNIAHVKAALNRVTAVCVINPVSNKSKLAYAHHDPGSQITLMQDLALNIVDDVSFALETINRPTHTNANLVEFDVQSLSSGETFFGITSVKSDPCGDESSTLSYRQILTGLAHFKDVNIIIGLENCNKVDIIIGNDNV